MLLKNLFFLLLILFSLENCIFANLPAIGGGGFRQDWEEKVITGREAEKILVIPIEGTISEANRSSFFNGFEESTVSQVKEALKFAERDRDIKGIILKINTPGGGVTASDIIYEEIMKFKRKRNIPIVAGFMDMATSGGYYIAMSADIIGAHPTTVTGSVGVITGGLNFKEGLDKVGIKDNSVTSGPNKTMNSSFQERNPEQRKIMQSIVDNLYDRFFQIVKRNRINISETKLKALCDGRIFSAEQAKSEGLIDFIGYFDDFQLAVMNHPKYSGPSMGNPRVILLLRGRGRVENIYQASMQDRSLNLDVIDKLVNPSYESKFQYLWNP